MTEIILPTTEELMYPTLEVLRDRGGTLAKAEILLAVSEACEITDEQLAVLHSPESGREPKVHHRIGWALTNLKKIKAAENKRRGVWTITMKGYEYLNLPRPDADKRLEQDKDAAYAELKKAREQELLENEENDEPEDKAQNDLLSTLMKMAPDAFERLAQRVLREAGFNDVEVTGKTGDGGIDGVGKYKVSLMSFPTYFQCKRISGSVTASTVRDFRGAMAGRGDKGLLITTGTFTRRAIEEANRDGAPPIDLINGEELCDLLVEYRIGVDVTERTVLDVEIRHEFFENI